MNFIANETEAETTKRLIQGTGVETIFDLNFAMERSWFSAKEVISVWPHLAYKLSKSRSKKTDPHVRTALRRELRAGIRNGTL